MGLYVFSCFGIVRELLPGAKYGTLTIGTRRVFLFWRSSPEASLLQTYRGKKRLPGLARLREDDKDDNDDNDDGTLHTPLSSSNPKRTIQGKDNPYPAIHHPNLRQTEKKKLKKKRQKTHPLLQPNTNATASLLHF